MITVHLFDTNMTDAAATAADRNDKEIILENHVPFTDCINEINNTQADNSKGLDVVILMYILRCYSNYYPETSGSLWHYYKEVPHDNIPDSKTIYINHLSRFANNSGDDCTADVEIAMSLNYKRTLWRTLEMPTINYKINLILIWSAYYAIIDTKLYVSVVPLSTKDNTKLLQSLKSGFERTINWNKYQ